MNSGGSVIKENNTTRTTLDQDQRLMEEWTEKLDGITEIQVTIRAPTAYVQAIKAMCATDEFWAKDVQDYCNSELMGSLVDLFHQGTLEKFHTRRVVAAGLAHLKDVEESLPEGVEKVLLSKIWKNKEDNSTCE
jgi:hypothetical protein